MGIARAGCIRDAKLRRFLIITAVIVALKLGAGLILASGLQDEIKPRYSIGAVDNYQSIAKNIVSGAGYRFTPDTALTLMREPGYPYFLAGLIQVFDDYHRASMVANILMTALSAFLIFNLTRLLTPDP